VIRLRPVAFVVAAWILGATTSIGVGLLALTLVGEDLRGDASRPLTADAAAVVDEPATPAPTTPVASPSASPVTSATEPSTDDRRLTSAGGDVVARCSADGAYLVYWSPAPGYRTDDVIRGPAALAMVQFEGLGVEVKVRVTCAGGIPQPQVVTEPHDDH
jgi:hypothetical protein